MRTDFIGHATLVVRTGAISLLTDPWWTGPAYRDQWYPYPIPAPERYDLSAVNAVYISHAHEDHLHRATLVELLRTAPDALAVIPARYDTSMRDYLVRIGFRRIREVPSGTSFALRQGGSSARLTIFTHMDDSILVVEADGQVLVNASDALHAAPRELIETYCRLLRRRFPRIDELFCGFGGASYFPNCVRTPGKDDEAVARAREQFFLQNFALIAARLQPRHAYPFAAHFVLPDERNWWISRTRLGMGAPANIARRYLHDLGADIPVYDLQPGDYVEDRVVHASPFPAALDPDSVRSEVQQRYPPSPPREPLDAAQFDALLAEVRAHADAYAARIGPDESLNTVLSLWDYPAAAIRVAVHGGAAQVAPILPERVETDQPDVVFETRSDLVRSTMRSPFGRDLITIGYAALVHLRSPAAVATNAHERLLNLLAPPELRWRQRLRDQPGRTLGFILGDASMRHAWRSRLGLGHRVAPSVADPSLYGIRDWTDAPSLPA